MGKSRVEIDFLNLDAECYNDLSTGKGFLITDGPTFEWEGGKQKSMFGPQSPLYGTSIDNNHDASTKFRCECGEFTGKAFRGEICPKCHGKVEFREADPEMTGWISMYPYKIINPVFYNMISGIFGSKKDEKGNETKNEFDAITNCQATVNRNGVRKKLNIDEIKELNPNNPYYGTGVYEFRNKYYEILNWLERKKPKKKQTIDFLRSNACKVFTSFIPVYTPMLRQSSVSGDSFYFTGIDKQINPIINLSQKLRDNYTDIDRDLILGRIQTRANAMWNINFDELDGKDGLIRDQISGGSVNYSSRNVIIPDPSLRDNEVELSYSTAHSLFRFQIIHNLMTMNGISLAQANDIWESAYIMDERVYKVICYILEKNKPKVVINRNPTLNYYSILLMNIRGIISDKRSYVMSVPLSVLPGLNADFDGDILNILGLFDPDIIKMFGKFDPVKYMVTNRDTGLLNKLFTITKGEKINLYNFCTL